MRTNFIDNKENYNGEYSEMHDETQHPTVTQATEVILVISCKCTYNASQEMRNAFYLAN